VSSKSSIDTLPPPKKNVISDYSTTMVHGTWKKFNQTRPSPKKKILTAVLLWYMGLESLQRGATPGYCVTFTEMPAHNASTFLESLMPNLHSNPFTHGQHVVNWVSPFLNSQHSPPPPLTFSKKFSTPFHSYQLHQTTGQF